MIILEGPDCSGKSTVAKVGFNELDYRHQGIFIGDQFVQMLQQLQEDVKRFCRHEIVQDRFHLSEQVYGPIYRERSALPHYQRRMLERYLFTFRTVVIKCLPSENVVVDRFEERTEQEMFGGKDHLDWESKLRAQWRGFYNLKTHLPVVRYNYERDNLLAVKNLVTDLRPCLNDGPGVGNWKRGNVLIVGEQAGPPNVKLNPQGHIGPFIQKGGCSEWLAARMDEAEIPERALYWINALQMNGDLTSPDFINRLQPSAVVALGGTARAWCEMAGVTDYQPWDHPQWWKRFHHHDWWPLMDELSLLAHKALKQ